MANVPLGFNTHSSCTFGGFVLNTNLKRLRSSFASNLLPMLLLLSLSLLSGPIVRAQTDTGRVTGSVTDSSGAVVPGSTVKLINTDTGATLTYTAGSDGNFTFSAVNRGNYRIEAAHSGFQSVEQTFVLQVSQVKTIELTLPIGTSSVTVEVTDAAPIVDLATSSTLAAVHGTQLPNLPLNS